MGLLEMIGRVFWVYLVTVVPILVLIVMVLLIKAMLNQVPVVRASNDRPRPETGSSRVRSSLQTPATQTPRSEIGSTSRGRNSPETPATQTDLAAVLDDPQLHARSRARVEQIDSLLPVIEEPECSICRYSMRADSDVKTLACRHEFHVECIDKWLNGDTTMNTKCPNCRATIPI